MSQDLSARDARHAAELDADVGVQQVGAIYAQAFLGAAEKAGETESLLAEFDSLLSDVLDRYPRFERILASGAISHDQKVGILDRVLASQASPILVNLLKVVSGHGRLDCLRAIHRQAHELYNRMRGRVRVRLSTATPISEELAGRIAGRMRMLLDAEPLLERVTDPELIGGVVVQVGDTVYDGSVANQLRNLRQQMVQRTAHEIQSRRDRFRHPAGN